MWWFRFESSNSRRVGREVKIGNLENQWIEKIVLRFAK